VLEEITKHVYLLQYLASSYIRCAGLWVGGICFHSPSAPPEPSHAVTAACWESCLGKHQSAETGRLVL
jgi:hypothetical protein